jgi:dynein heavy chain, axonemal
MVLARRGSHAAALVGRKVFIFGGYGGEGYARKDFNDLYALDVDTFDWEPIEVSGDVSLRHGGEQSLEAA